MRVVVKRRLAGLLVLTAAIAGLTGAPAFGIDGGTAVTTGDYAYTAHLDIGGVRACTGVLVAPSWIVTAGDCYPGGTLDQPTTVIVGRATLSAGATGYVRTVTGLVRHPDGAVILARLDNPVADVTPAAIATTAPAAGETLRSAGYGRTETQWITGQLRSADLVVDSVSAASLDLTGAALCKGDAGGPIFREDGELVAINDRSWQGGCLGETETRTGGTGTRVDTLADWIKRNTLDPATATLTNGSFESGLTGWTQYGTGTLTASTGRAYAGTTSAKIVDSTTTAGNGAESTHLPAAPGITYTATAEVNVTTGSPDLYLRFLDASGTQLAAPATTYSGTANQWNKLTLTAVAPAGTQQVSVLLYSSYAHTGTSYVDQITLSRQVSLPVTNPGFESSLTGWNQYQAGGNTTSPDFAYEGVASAKIVDASTTTATGLESAPQPALAGVAYTATARVNVTAGTPSLWIRFLDSSGTVLTSTATTFSGTPGTWTPLSATLIAPAGTVHVTALLYSNLAGTSTSYFNQVGLARTSDVTVPAQSFENGLDGWTQYGSGGNLASTDRAYTGTTSAKIADTGATTATGLESTHVPATAGVTYNASAWLYVQSGAPTVYVRFFDATGTLLTSASTDYAGATNSWQPIRLTATAPAGTTSMTVLLYSKLATTSTTYADNIAIQ